MVRYLNNLWYNSFMPSEIRYMNGYRLIYKPEHHRALHGSGWEGYVYEHQLIAEEILGRPLREDEEVHHLDGQKSNNLAKNLIVLEASQHSKLHQWMRLIEISYKDPRHLPQERECPVCKKKIYNYKLAKYCSAECDAIDKRRVSRPSKEELEKDILEVRNFTALGRKYGVTDNAIRKWARQYGLPTKTRKL